MNFWKTKVKTILIFFFFPPIFFHNQAIRIYLLLHLYIFKIYNKLILFSFFLINDFLMDLVIVCYTHKIIFHRKLNFLKSKFLCEFFKKYEKLFGWYSESNTSQEVNFYIMFGSTINFQENNIKITKITFIINYVILFYHY